ncbi:MAG: acyl-CoA dehydrogenase [Candidatus Helarchaeota archaeon]|nr:acyl-CoA dehydrogenase [Candidatus Helarchaeota archaeon]
MLLLNPKKHDRGYPDERSKEIMLKTIKFFENKGKKKLKEDEWNRVWYDDFLEFQKENQIFADLLTPTPYGGENARWDAWRLFEFSEILGFYGLAYWYTFQVSILGLCPIWMSKNEKAKRRAAELLKKGAIFAFGLSEREHGADIYSSDMRLTPKGEGTYVANGEKYYIGNGNKAEMVSTFGKMSNTDDYVFFVANYQNKHYNCVKNVIENQSYVSNYVLKDYPITEDDVLSKGRDAWNSTLNTVNVGKFNLGTASIGICTHALYEALNHASHRKLFNQYVTEFPQIQQLFMDSWARLMAMKIYSLRATDYFRSASSSDKRYILYNSLAKMKVTTQGEHVIRDLFDIIAAKGFEKDTYFSGAAVSIVSLPKLEGTVHVNMALVLRFIPNYFFDPGEFPTIPPKIMDIKSDNFNWNQGPTKGLSKIKFHDYNIAYDSIDLPNVNIFKEQVASFKDFLFNTPIGDKQQKNIDFLLSVGELFTMVAYGQLIIENLKPYNIEDDITEQIFDFMIRDFSHYALDLHYKRAIKRRQAKKCLQMIKKPVKDEERFQRILENHVYTLADLYEMNE